MRAAVDGGAVSAGVAAIGGTFCTGVAASLDAAPTVTIGAILSIVLLGTPALLRSATDENGRPAILFFAVAGPTPGNASSAA